MQNNLYLAQNVSCITVSKAKLWNLTWSGNKVRELATVCLLIMNLYQLDKESTKFTIWKY